MLFELKWKSTNPATPLSRIHGGILLHTWTNHSSILATDLLSGVSHHFILFYVHLRLHPRNSSISALLPIPSKPSSNPFARVEFDTFHADLSLLYCLNPCCLKTSQCTIPHVSHIQLASCLAWFLCPAESHPNFKTLLCPHFFS